RVGNGNGSGSAAVPGRINPATDAIRVSITRILYPNIHGLWAAKNGRAPATRWKRQRLRERGRPRPHQPGNQLLRGFDTDTLGGYVALWKIVAS
ncbi:MAG: hypothetical protein ACP5MD_05960, partial [Verrucomicrobiia bacterium]